MVSLTMELNTPQTSHQDGRDMAQHDGTPPTIPMFSGGVLMAPYCFRMFSSNLSLGCTSIGSSYQGPPQRSTFRQSLENSSKSQTCDVLRNNLLFSYVFHESAVGRTSIGSGCQGLFPKVNISLKARKSSRNPTLVIFLRSGVWVS